MGRSGRRLSHTPFVSLFLARVARSPHVGGEGVHQVVGAPWESRDTEALEDAHVVAVARVTPKRVVPHAAVGVYRRHREEEQ